MRTAHSRLCNAYASETQCPIQKSSHQSLKYEIVRPQKNKTQYIQLYQRCPILFDRTDYDYNEVIFVVDTQEHSRTNVYTIMCLIHITSYVRLRHAATSVRCCVLRPYPEGVGAVRQPRGWCVCTFVLWARVVSNNWLGALHWSMIVTITQHIHSSCAGPIWIIIYYMFVFFVLNMTLVTVKTI